MFLGEFVHIYVLSGLYALSEMRVCLSFIPNICAILRAKSILIQENVIINAKVCLLPNESGSEIAHFAVILSTFNI